MKNIKLHDFNKWSKWTIKIIGWIKWWNLYCKMIWEKWKNRRGGGSNRRWGSSNRLTKSIEGYKHSNNSNGGIRISNNYKWLKRLTKNQRRKKNKPKSNHQNNSHNKNINLPIHMCTIKVMLISNSLSSHYWRSLDPIILVILNCWEGINN